MANVNAPFGARVVGITAAAKYIGSIRPYTILASDAKALYPGDFVKSVKNAEVSDWGKFPNVVATQATVGAPILGVVFGFLADPDDLSSTYRKASTLRTALVIDDPDAIFVIQSDGVIAVTDVRRYADIAIGTPSNVFGTSGMVLDQSTLSDTAEQLQILDLYKVSDNEYGNYARMVCRIAEHE